MTFQIGDPGCWDAVPVREIFDETVLNFFDALSRRLFADTAAHAYSDVLAFAIWCRRSALARQKRLYGDGNLYLGRGLVFHVSPSNIPLMFAYTLAVGLLSGNANIVRLPSRAFPQVEYFCQQVETLIRSQAHQELSRYIACIRYDRDDAEITRYLSERCDVRVIWGGDTTVREIRKSPLQPGAFDVVFPDRYSVVVIDSDAWLRCKDKKARIRSFYNDTYLSDQSSCSAPRLVLWLGSQVQVARDSFWGLLEKAVRELHQLAPASVLSKLEYSYTILARHVGSELASNDVTVTRVWCPKLEPDLMDGHPGQGVFIESDATTVDALLPMLRRRCQTISYYGVPVDDLVSLLRRSGPRGGDRIVPMGNTIEFSLTWDGYDTIRSLSRKIEITTWVADGHNR